MQAIDKKLTRSYFRRLLVASYWPKCATFWGVCRESGRCLEGTSGWSLSDPGYF